MRGNMTQVHVEFTCLEVENFCVLVAHLVLAHHRQPFDAVELSMVSAVCSTLPLSVYFLAPFFTKLRLTPSL